MEGEAADVTQVDAIDEGDEEMASVGEANWLRRGQTIGRYVIVDRLGVGGMGIVYSAWDPKLDRRLAIKLVRVQIGASGATRGRNRLMREAQALARVRHPNVITVHDVGTHEGRVFVAMEFIEGVTLLQWLEQTPERPFRQLLDVFLQAGRGLAAAHRAGLVHRDFKPENVMIASDGRVLVLDFGIARGPTTGVEDPPGLQPAPVTKVEESDDGEVANEVADEVADEVDEAEFAPSERVQDGMTRPGAIVGTLSYMSPEQRRRRPLDSRSDQFSYCVALWEALGRERPFGEAPAQKLLARMRLGQIRPMRRRDVPRRVIAALHRGLAWTSTDRFPSMEALLEALNPRQRGPARVPLVLGASALVVALAALVISLLPSDRLEPSAPICTIDRARVDALWNPGRVDQIGEALRIHAGEAADSPWRRGRERIDAWTERWLKARTQTCERLRASELGPELHDLRVACFDRQLDRLEAVLASLESASSDELEGLLALVAELPDPERCTDDAALGERSPEPDSASSRARLAELRAEAERLEVEFELGHYERGLEPARQLVAAAREADYPPLLARALLLLGNFLEREGVQAEAERVLLEAARDAAGARELEIEAKALIGLANLVSVRGLHDEGLRWLELAEGLAGSTREGLHLRVSLANARAAIAHRRGDWAAAELAFEAARAMIEDEGHGNPEFDMQLPWVLQNLAVVIDRRGDPRRALELHRRALAIYELQLGPTHPRIALVRTNLAATLLELGEPDAAMAEFTRALALFEASVGPGVETALTRAQLGRLHDALGECKEARALLDRGVAELELAAPEGIEHASLLITRASLCDYADASALIDIDHAAAIHERLEDPDHVDRSRDPIERALALLARARSDEAWAELERVRPRGPELPVRDQARLAAASGLVLLAQGERDEARAALVRARPDLPPGSPLARRVAAAISHLSLANE